ncbi:TetR/AcrR family transcriptional regulator [Alicyclobacillus sp. SP_1]|uniref:TetR/AcrR family transcriptional regulator n=1 Tax=Alicyclobacillus sp. SP_1 TaxID=2942475 RepID=UPI0021589DAD|nr:TetR/AcrR family transcriptional regulator [Alicyclobacillus sp. SP_1]
MATRKELQMSRMWMYFVDATAKIIEEEGMENVTIRKVADLAGYTSATIYNYFNELSHLIFFASMRFLKDYTQELSVYMSRGKDSIEKYLLTWECFCQHSFRNPQVFHAIFISDLGSQPDELLKRYYSVYQSDLTGLPEDIKPLVFEYSLSKRSQAVLEKAVAENLLDEQDIESINEMTVLIWQGMMTTVLNNRRNYTPDEASQRTMRYIREATMIHVKSGMSPS